jgi:MarR family transcriptional regulator, organic hydroperoxide resistance regulator
VIVSKNPPSKPVGKFALSEHLPHLLKHIHSQLQSASAGHLAEFGVSVAIWRILAVLWEHGDLSHRELAELTAIEVSTLSRLSKGAERDGLICRTRTQENQRTVRVTLTEKGRCLTRAIIPSALSWQAYTVGNLSSEDVKTVTRILHVLVQNLSAYTKTDVDIDQAPRIPETHAEGQWRLMPGCTTRRNRGGHFAP